MYLEILAAYALVVTEVACEGGPGAENLSQLQFGMWIFAFPARGEHSVPLPILTGFLMRFLEFCDGFRGLFCS